MAHTGKIGDAFEWVDADNVDEAIARLHDMASARLGPGMRYELREGYTTLMMWSRKTRRSVAWYHRPEFNSLSHDEWDSPTVCLEDDGYELLGRFVSK